MFVSVAQAQEGSPAPVAGAGYSSIILIVLMFAIFYFLLIRPQQKRSKEHKTMIEALQKGDHVITSGGLMGRIVEVEDGILTVDLGDSKVRIPRAYINNKYDPKALVKAAEDTPSRP